MFSNVPSSEGPGQMEISFERISMIILVGRDDWELFAEKLGLTPATGYVFWTSAQGTKCWKF